MAILTLELPYRNERGLRGLRAGFHFFGAKAITRNLPSNL